MTAVQYRDFPLTAFWLLADARKNERDIYSVTMAVARIRRGDTENATGTRATLRAAVRQRLEMYGVWAL